MKIRHIDVSNMYFTNSKTMKTLITILIIAMFFQQTYSNVVSILHDSDLIPLLRTLMECKGVLPNSVCTDLAIKLVDNVNAYIVSQTKYNDIKITNIDGILWNPLKYIL